jgi:hypothetical protein
MWKKLIDFMAFCVGLVAISSEAVRRFVAWLVKVMKWIEGDK